MSKLSELQNTEKDTSFGFKPNGAHAYSLQASKSNGTHWASEEALRLVQQIFLLQAEAPRVVVFSGVDHGNGCSRVCASVAETLAKNGRRRVCLVEANFRSPSLAGLFGTTNQQGFLDALLQKGPVTAFAKPIIQDYLWLLPSGRHDAESPNVLTPEHLRHVLHQLRQEFEFVIIDAPPLARYSDAIVLGQLSDGLVLIIEADSTRRAAASVVTANLKSANVSVLAGVLNKRTFPIPEMLYRRL